MFAAAIQVADPDEVRRFKSRPGDPYSIVRFALHVEKRDPTNVWAPATLANYSESPEERLYMLYQAMTAGERRWGADKNRDAVEWWDDVETRQFMFVIRDCAKIQAELGDPASAAVHIRELLAMDPEDRIGAEELASSVGLIPNAAADVGHAFTM